MSTKDESVKGDTEENDLQTMLDLVKDTYPRISALSSEMKVRFLSAAAILMKVDQDVVARLQGDGY